MNVGELQLALLPYPVGRKVILLIEGQEQRAYTVASVDEIRDDPGKHVVIIACKEEYPE